MKEVFDRVAKRADFIIPNMLPGTDIPQNRDVICITPSNNIVFYCAFDKTLCCYGMNYKRMA